MSLKYTITNEQGEVYTGGKIWLDRYIGSKDGYVLVTDDEDETVSIEEMVDAAEAWDKANLAESESTRRLNHPIEDDPKDAQEKGF